MRILNDIKDLLSIKAWKKANKAFQEDFEKKFIHRLKTQGQFEYFDNGFSLQNKIDSAEIKWAAIKEIKAYKVDLYIVDEIRINIITNDSTITISEETPGYYFFKDKIKEIFPDSLQNWEIEITKPAFKENLIIIYKSITL